MIHITSLFSVATAESILKVGLDLATAAGLPVTSWRVDDAMNVLLKFTARILGERDANAAEIAKGGFLSTAEGDWAKVVAYEVYGVEPDEAGYARSTLTLTNVGGGRYPKEPGEFSCTSSLTNKSYHSVTAFTIDPLGTATVIVEADEPGTDSNAGVNEIDTITTPMLGVSITASTSAVTTDEQSIESLKEQARSTLGALSPNGPPDAYEYVARNSALTGTTEVTRAKAIANSSTGVVAVYVAGANGAVSGGAVTAVTNAIRLWATPLTITSTAYNATPHELDVAVVVTGDDIPAGFYAQAVNDISALCSATQIGGRLTRSDIISRLHSEAKSMGAANVSVVPSLAADVVLAASEVLVPGTVTVGSS